LLVGYMYAHYEVVTIARIRMIDMAGF